MTTVVGKGTNRPAHYKRRNKHAQRTPLPPRAGLPNPPAKSTAAIIREERDRMTATPTAAQQKALVALAKSPDLTELVVHPKTAAALVENKWARRLKDGRWKLTAAGSRYAADTDAEPAAPASPTKRRAGKPVGATPATDAQPAGDLDPMSARFVAAARENGWAVEVSHPRPGKDAMTATRGDEVVYCARADGKLDMTDMPYAVIAGRKVHMRNLSAAIKQMSLPDDARPIRRELRQSAVGRRQTTDDRPVRETLPFSEDSSDEEIIAAVLGRQIIWRNGVSGSRQSQQVTARSAHIRLDSHVNGRILTFNGVETITDNGVVHEAMTGTFSIYVHRILRVK